MLFIWIFFVGNEVLVYINLENQQPHCLCKLEIKIMAEIMKESIFYPLPAQLSQSKQISSRLNFTPTHLYQTLLLPDKKVRKSPKRSSRTHNQKWLFGKLKISRSIWSQRWGIYGYLASHINWWSITLSDRFWSYKTRSGRVSDISSYW